MIPLGRFIMDTAKVALTTLNRANDPRSSSLVFQSPSPNDVLEVKNVLLKVSNLPLELVDVIIDYAEYWPRTSVSTAGETLAVGGRGNPREDVFVVSSLMLETFPSPTFLLYSSC
jgi:hypothetical protein